MLPYSAFNKSLFQVQVKTTDQNKSLKSPQVECQNPVGHFEISVNFVSNNHKMCNTFYFNVQIYSIREWHRTKYSIDHERYNMFWYCQFWKHNKFSPNAFLIISSSVLSNHFEIDLEEVERLQSNISIMIYITE